MWFVTNRETLPTSYSDWKKALIQLDANRMLITGMREDRENYGRTFGGTHGQQRTFGNFAYRAPQRDPNAMDVDRVLTREQVNEYRQKNQCFECGETGHMARNCPVRRRRQQGNNQGNRNFQRNGGFQRNNFRGNQQRANVRAVATDDEAPANEDGLWGNGTREEKVASIRAAVLGMSEEDKEIYQEAIQGTGFGEGDYN